MSKEHNFDNGCFNKYDVWRLVENYKVYISNNDDKLCPHCVYKGKDEKYVSSDVYINPCVLIASCSLGSDSIPICLQCILEGAKKVGVPCV